MNTCPTCGQVVPDALAEKRLTAAELRALSAWWWAKSARGAGRILGLTEQTVKNQLMRARQRNQCHKTVTLAETFAAQLLTLEELVTQHNRGRRAA